MKRLAIPALILPTAAALAQSLVGQTLPPYPPGFSPQEESCVAGELGVERACERTISYLRHNTGKMVILGSKLASRGSNGRATYSITDEIPYPDVRPGYVLVLGCKRSGKLDNTLLALVKDDPEQPEWKEVIWAKRLDLTSGKFVEASTRGVSCPNEGFGI